MKRRFRNVFSYKFCLEIGLHRCRNGMTKNPMKSDRFKGEIGSLLSSSLINPSFYIKKKKKKKKNSIYIYNSDDINKQKITKNRI